MAERIASLVPNPVLVKLPTLAHGALDTREPAALAVAGAVCRGELDGLAERGEELDALPPRPAIRLLVKALDVAVAAEGALPSPPRRLVRRLATT
ncbi:hydrolase [Mycobacterium tuberculosis]|nr:hydrolase [Mycobacterium tuberculosis]